MHVHDCDQRNANCYKRAESEICLNTGVKEVLPLISKSSELRKDRASSQCIRSYCANGSDQKKGSSHCF